MPCRDDRSRLVLLFTLSACFVLWNLADEMYIIGSIGALAGTFIHWILVPFFVMLAGVRAKTSPARRTFLYSELAMTLLFMLYALNGSTQERQGAGHMHLFFIPMLLLFIGGAVLTGYLLSLVGRPRQPVRNAAEEGLSSDQGEGKG